MFKWIKQLFACDGKQIGHEIDVTHVRDFRVIPHGSSIAAMCWFSNAHGFLCLTTPELKVMHVCITE